MRKTFIVTVMDMHSGGGSKGVGPELIAGGWKDVEPGNSRREYWWKAFDALSELHAEGMGEVNFSFLTGCDPYYVTCECCGQDFSFITWEQDEWNDYRANQKARGF